jgi:hypothetical protein
MVRMLLAWVSSSHAWPSRCVNWTLLHPSFVVSHWIDCVYTFLPLSSTDLCPAVRSCAVLVWLCCCRESSSAQQMTPMSFLTGTSAQAVTPATMRAFIKSHAARSKAARRN